MFFHDSRSQPNSNAPVLARPGDCPLVDSGLLDEMIQVHEQDVDYLSNCIQPTYPDGLDIEIFTRHALLLAHEQCTEDAQRTH